MRGEWCWTAPSTRSLRDADLRVVPDHEPVGPRLSVPAPDLDVAAQQRGLHTSVEITHRRAGEQDGVLDLGVADHAVLADGGIGTHVAVGQPRAGADDGG